MKVPLLVPLLALWAAPLPSLGFQIPARPHSISLTGLSHPVTAKPWKTHFSKPFMSSDVDELIVEASNTLHRISWLSWWSQVILTVVSSVTLIFARNVLTAGKSPGAEGLLLAGSGLVVSFLSIFWTWGGARLGKRILKRDTGRLAAASMIRRAISVGVSLNLLGMALALIGAEQIVGGLAVKVLTQQGVFGGIDRAVVQTLQPLDILVVQGNTNTLLSHFCSLVALLYQTKLVQKLDPPSAEGNERNRA